MHSFLLPRLAAVVSVLACVASCAAPTGEETVDDGSAAVEVGSSPEHAEITRHLPLTFTTTDWSQRFYADERVKPIGMTMEMDCAFERLSNWRSEREIPGRTVYVVRRLDPRRGPAGTALARKHRVVGFVDEAREWRGETTLRSAGMYFSCQMREDDALPTWSAMVEAIGHGAFGGIRGKLTWAASAP